MQSFHQNVHVPESVVDLCLIITQTIKAITKRMPITVVVTRMEGAPWNASYRAIYLMRFPTALSIDSRLKPPTEYSCKNMQFFLSILEFARKHVHLPSSSIFLKKIGRWPFRKTAIKDKYVCKLRMYIILCAYLFSN